MIQLGIIGTGRIANRFMSDLDLVPDIRVTGVFNPHIDSARQFGDHHQIKLATDDWDEFLSSVEAVYIASPHHTHVEYAKSALKNYKHVLCEKPMAFSEKEAEELFAIAQQHKLVLMEAIKTAYCPGFCHLLETVNSGIIGQVRDVEACFTKLTDPSGRELADLEYGGSLIELGTYVLLPVFKIFGTDLLRIQFQSIKDEKGIDLYTKVHLCFEQGFGLGKVGLGIKSEGELIISGTKGYIYVKAPWWLTKEYEIRFEDPDKRERYAFEFERNGLQYELQAFVKELQADNKEYDEKKKISVALAGIMEQYFVENDRNRLANGR